MARDPISKRFGERDKKRRINEYDNRTRSTEDIEAEQELLANTEPVEPIEADDTPGRNDPCPCGSGRKYKKCWGADT